jgi:hypothetical protein
VGELERVSWLSNKIEQARRNVEICLRGYTDLAGSDSDIRKLFEKAIEVNIKILHETPDMALGTSEKKTA